MEEVKDTYLEFAPLPQEEHNRRFQGFNDVNFSEKKSQEARRKNGGVYKGQWVEPEVYTPQNLPPWYYEPNWTNERRFNWMNLEREKRRLSSKTLKEKKGVKTLRLKTTNEMRMRDYVGNPADEQGTLNDILYKYLKEIAMSLPNGGKSKSVFIGGETEPS